MTATVDRLRKFLIAEREKRKWTQRELAKQCGVSYGTIAYIEAGRGSIPRQGTLEAIAKGLGVPYTTLDHIVRDVAPENAASAELPELDAQAAQLYELCKRVPPEHQKLARRMLELLVDQ